MDEDVKEAIRTHGIRNALLTSIAPTGTISLLAGNVSSGIEPVFAYSYTRKVLQPDGTRTEEEVVDYAVALWREKFGDAPLPDHFVNAQTLTPRDHVRMQAAAQKWVDSSISIQEHLSRGLRNRLQGLHHLPAKRGDGFRAFGQRGEREGPRGRQRR